MTRGTIVYKVNFGSLHSAGGCRHAKMFIHGPDKQLSHFALGLKKQPRILVGLLNGHIALNRHLTVMKI